MDPLGAQAFAIWGVARRIMKVRHNLIETRVLRVKAPVSPRLCKGTGGRGG